MDRQVKLSRKGGNNVDLDHLQDKERYDVLAEMADMYYNQGKTQSEIASSFGTNRFRVARLLQEARTEQIVEIRINYSNARNRLLESRIRELYPLDKVLVVNTRYSSYIDGLAQIGKVGAGYLARLLEPGAVLGLTWGKTLHSVISRLPEMNYSPVTAVQLTGFYKMASPAADTRELVRTAAARCGGDYFYLDAPLYVKDPRLSELLCQEPVIGETFHHTRRLDVVASGIGSRSSLPLVNPAVRPYLTLRDQEQAEACIGSLYGRVLNQEGREADIDLNRRIVSARLEDILAAPHRLVVACGRHKVQVLKAAAKQGWFNELLTDSDTAANLIQAGET